MQGVIFPMVKKVLHIWIAYLQWPRSVLSRLLRYIWGSKISILKNLRPSKLSNFLFLPIWRREKRIFFFTNFRRPELIFWPKLEPQNCSDFDIWKVLFTFGSLYQKSKKKSLKLPLQPILNIFSVPWWKLLGTCTILKHSFPKNIIIISIGVKFDDPCKAAAAAAKLIKKGAPMGEEVWSWQLTTLSSNLTDMWNYDYPVVVGFQKTFLRCRT